MAPTIWKPQVSSDRLGSSVPIWQFQIVFPANAHNYQHVCCPVGDRNSALKEGRRLQVFRFSLCVIWPSNHHGDGHADAPPVVVDQLGLFGRHVRSNHLFERCKQEDADTY